MSFEQFFHREHLSTVDKMVGHIRRNKKLYRQLVVLVAIYGLMINPAYASVNTSAIDVLGLRILKLSRVIGYWVIIVKGSIEVIGQAAHGDPKNAIKTLMQYGLIFAVLFMFPMMLDMIREAFE